MKKIVLSIAVVVSVVMMAACGGKTSEKAVEANESEIATKIQNCTNPDSIKVYVDQAKAYAQKLVDEGKVDEAKKYLEKIEPVVKEKAPALSGVLSTVEGALDKLGDKASETTDSVKNAAADKVNEAKDAAADKVNEAKDAVADKTAELKDKAAEKADEAKQKAAEATDKAAEKVKGLFD